MELASISERSLAWLLGLNTLIHEIGIPLPMMPTALLAGARVNEGEANAIALVLVVTLATLIGNSVWFAAGRVFGGRVLKTLCKISLSQDTCVGRTERAFTKFGRWSLVVGHFIPGVSLVAPPLAGALGMKWSTFIGFTAMGGALYGSVVIGAGMLLGSAILALANAVLAHGGQSIAVLLLACAAYVAWKWWRRHLNAKSLRAPRISVAELQEALRGIPPAIVVDVRGEATRRADARSIPGALSSTIEGITQLLADQPRSANIVVYCACPNDASAAQAVRLLNAAGYTHASALRGGLDAWLSEERTALERIRRA
jgi:membrane protein DedA with SNARE-associated domain/rhodanese-related sulfurtransferase